MRPAEVIAELRVRRADTIAEGIRACTACSLHQTRTQAVPFTGPADRGTRQVIFIGEAPGQQEDLKGEPFVGPAGSVFNTILKGFGMTRDDVYIHNVIASRPPGNDFTKAIQVRAVEACAGWLKDVIVFSGAWLVVALGNNAYQSLVRVGEGGIGKVRGRPVMYDNTRILLPTYHPAYALRTPVAVDYITEDLEPWLRGGKVALCSSEQVVKEIRTNPGDREELLGLWYDARAYEASSPQGAPLQGVLL